MEVVGRLVATFPQSHTEQEGLDEQEIDRLKIRNLTKSTELRGQDCSDLCGLSLGESKRSGARAGSLLCWQPCLKSKLG